ILTRVDTHHGSNRYIDAGGNAAKAAVEFQALVVHHESLYCHWGDVENDLPILDEVLWHFHTFGVGVHQDVGSTVVVENPFIEGPHQVGAVRGHRHNTVLPRYPQVRISLSCSEKLAWMDSRSSRRAL